MSWSATVRASPPPAEAPMVKTFSMSPPNCTALL